MHEHSINFSYRWVHEYQDACINKLQSFLRGLLKSLPDRMCQPKSQVQSPSSVVEKTLQRTDTLDLPKPADWMEFNDNTVLIDG